MKTYIVEGKQVTSDQIIATLIASGKFGLRAAMQLKIKIIKMQA
jgi:hypothetical protein